MNFHGQLSLNPLKRFYLKFWKELIFSLTYILSGVATFHSFIA
jgi:hypothetical protein